MRGQQKGKLFQISDVSLKMSKAFARFAEEV